MPNLKGKKVILRYFSMDDFEDYYEFAKNPLVGYNAGWKPHDDMNVSRRILQAKVFSASNFAIIDKKTNKLLGSIELNPSHIRERIKSFEIGYALNPTYWGMGYASDAVRVLMKYAFEKMNALVVEMCHIESNIRSEHVALACGFIYEGTLRAYKLMYDGRIVDVKMYRITLSEYKKIK